MTPWNTKHRGLWAQLAGGIEAAEMARLDAFEDAFNRLCVLDKELAQLALAAFRDADIAADCMARHRFEPTNATAYSLLADGQRARVAEWLRAEIDIVEQACSKLSSMQASDSSMHR